MSDRALEEAVACGKTRFIGVSNFCVHHLEKLLKQCKIKPLVNQFELHPLLTQVEVTNRLIVGRKVLKTRSFETSAARMTSSHRCVHEHGPGAHFGRHVP